MMNALIYQINFSLKNVIKTNLIKIKYTNFCKVILDNIMNEYMKHSVKANIIWIDLEMTGLDLSKDRILEVASLVTDNDLNIVSSEFQMVIHQSDETFEKMVPWCQNQHAKSGLIEESRNTENNEQDVEESLLKFLKRYTSPQQCPLAGNCLYMDRAFIKKHMPRLYNYLAPEVIDVASINELARRWHKKAERKKQRKQGDHRALGDIKDSIQELSYYKNNILQ